MNIVRCNKCGAESSADTHSLVTITPSGRTQLADFYAYPARFIGWDNHLCVKCVGELCRTYNLSALEKP